MPYPVDLRINGARVKRFDVSGGTHLPLLSGDRSWPEVGQLIIEGPFAPTSRGTTASRTKIFVCRPAAPKDEAACARTILLNLTRRAFRRPVTDADIQPLESFYRSGRTAPGDFDNGIQKAIEALLVSPEFLFRIEQDPAAGQTATAYRVSDVELASRLSFFLWSTIPDDQLLDLAERGRLSDPIVLERQVRRMLDDLRADALVANFAGQWLHLRSIELSSPDPVIFPFDEALRQGFTKETELFIRSLFREDRSLLDLLTADYTFVNERLAEHYGIPGIYGSQFRRVTRDRSPIGAACSARAAS